MTQIQLTHEYSHSQKSSYLNSKLKFSPVMEEVLLALCVYCILSGKSKLVSIHSELCFLLQRSPNAIGSALKSLKKLELIDYYCKGRQWIVEIKLSNLFISSLMARFFGFKISLSQETGQFDDYPILGFYPLNTMEETLTFFSNKITQLDSQITLYQEYLTWYEETIRLEKSAERLQTDLKNQDDSSPYILFVEKFLSRIAKQQAIQTQTISYIELKQILEQLLDDYRELPPWMGGGSSLYSPLKVDEDEL